MAVWCVNRFAAHGARLRSQRQSAGVLHEDGGVIQRRECDCLLRPYAIPEGFRLVSTDLNTDSFCPWRTIPNDASSIHDCLVLHASVLQSPALCSPPALSLDVNVAGNCSTQPPLLACVENDLPATPRRSRSQCTDCTHQRALRLVHPQDFAVQQGVTRVVGPICSTCGSCCRGYCARSRGRAGAAALPGAPLRMQVWPPCAMHQ